MDVERFETLIKDRLTKSEFYKISNDSVNSKEKIQAIDRKVTDLVDTRGNLENNLKKKIKKIQQTLHR